MQNGRWRHISMSKVHLLVRIFQYQILVFLKTKYIFLLLHCLLTTNGQLNDTRGYHIKPTNSTCNMISVFRLIGPCSSGLGQKKYFSVQSNFNHCRKVLSMKIIWINIRTKICTPTSVLRWEFASV